jgi:hypothetical protein
LDGTAVYNGIVGNRYFVADNRSRPLIGTVNNGSILYIAIIADGNRMYIPTYYRIEPNATVVSHFYFAYHSGIVCQKTIIAYLRMYAPYRFY